MTTRQRPFYITLIAIFIGIISPYLLSDGMFMDGLLYATISNNLAHGIGNIWNLFLTNTFYPHFHEHPPLAFVLQSFWFRLFGDSILIERLYSVSTFFITGYLISIIWKKTVSKSYANLSWLPILFWISIPLITWSATNNMLENTMMIFTSLSIIFYLNSIDNNRFIYIVLSGIMLFLGVLTKGLVALFPLSFLFWIFIFTRKTSFIRSSIDIILSSLTIIGSFLAIFLIFPNSYNNLLEYFNKQILGSIQSISTVNSRLFIVFRLFKELIPSFIIALIFLFLTRKRKIKLTNYKYALVFLALGFSGVIPIMISMKQSGFYILATFPFFGIGIALLLADRVNSLISRIDVNSRGFKIFNYISFILLIISISLSCMQINKIGRDKNKITDIYSIIQLVPKGTDISIQKDIRQDWSIHGYFYRYANISLDTNPPINHNFLLVLKDYNKEVPFNFKESNVKLNLYKLYKKDTLIKK